MDLIHKLLDPQVIVAITGLVTAVGALALRLNIPGFTKQCGEKDGGNAVN